MNPVLYHLDIWSGRIRRQLRVLKKAIQEKRDDLHAWAWYQWKRLCGQVIVCHWCGREHAKDDALPDVRNGVLYWECHTCANRDSWGFSWEEEDCEDDFLYEVYDDDGYWVDEDEWYEDDFDEVEIEL